MKYRLYIDEVGNHDPIRKNPQSVKAALAELESQSGAEMHPETFKRFLKNLVSRSAASAPVSSRGK